MRHPPKVNFTSEDILRFDDWVLALAVRPSSDKTLSDRYRYFSLLVSDADIFASLKPQHYNGCQTSSQENGNGLTSEEIHRNVCIFGK